MKQRHATTGKNRKAGGCSENGAALVLTRIFQSFTAFHKNSIPHPTMLLEPKSRVVTTHFFTIFFWGLKHGRPVSNILGLILFFKSYCTCCNYTISVVRARFLKHLENMKCPQHNVVTDKCQRNLLLAKNCTTG